MIYDEVDNQPFDPKNCRDCYDVVGCMGGMKEQIERLKCCGNCKYMEEDCEYFYCTNLNHVHDELKKNDYIDLDAKFIGTHYNQKCENWETKE